MAFICDPCRAKHFTNEPSIRSSVGPCEWCKQERECSDIPSGALRARPAKRKEPSVKNKSNEEEGEEKRHAVREAASWLQPNHYTWIVNAAIKHFHDQIARAEIEIVRHERFAKEPLNNMFGMPEDREVEIAEKKVSINQYRLIMTFLVAVQAFLSHQSAVDFAKSFFGSRATVKR